MKSLLFKLLKKGEGYFTHSHSIENPMWFYFVWTIGWCVIGFVLGKVV